MTLAQLTVLMRTRQGSSDPVAEVGTNDDLVRMQAAAGARGGFGG